MSIKRLISIQLDFTNQETELQTHFTKLGVKSNRIPVAHCKIAAGVIEFGSKYFMYQSNWKRKEE